ncbi:MAG: acetolactate synthase small subunit [Sulfurospirillaceae bacterium]|nr:acetolactate synthase small subunit [Sulfurospirillaceae bacterium]
MRRVLSVIVTNEHGVLSRISGLFAGRGYNIDTLTVAPIPDTNFSRLTIVTSGNENVLEQIVKQLHKLIPTYKVIESGEFVEKEMALVKIPLGEDFNGLDAMLKAYNGTIANSGADFIVVMVADNAKRIQDFLKAIKKYNPTDMVRSGSVAMDV